LELGESLRDAAGRGHIDAACAVSIVPIQSEIEVRVTSPFGGDGVEGLRWRDVGLVRGRYSEIIDNPSEDRTSSMIEET
jgi:hypothetical protein